MASSALDPLSHLLGPPISPSLLLPPTSPSACLRPLAPTLFSRSKRFLLWRPPDCRGLGPVCASAPQVDGVPAQEVAGSWAGLGAQPAAENQLRLENAGDSSLYTQRGLEVDGLLFLDGSLVGEASDEETDDTDYDIDELVEMDAEGMDSEEERFEDECDYIENLSLEGDSDGRSGKFGRVERFRKRMQTSDDQRITVKKLAGLFNFPLDKFQRLAIEVFLKGSSIVVCAPTSSGKTLVAEAAAVTTMSMGKRLFYTTPLKALSNQKLREFREMFGEENVGLLTGDSIVNRNAPILIMTAEILRNMLYQSVGTLEEGSRLYGVHAIVLDEVHYLSDISRGTVWEETVIYCPKEVQLICLSATVANPEELAGWIAQVHGPTELVTSKKRPVPLTWHFSTRYSLSPLLNEQASDINRSLSLTSFQEYVTNISPRSVLGDVKRKQARGSSFGNSKQSAIQGHGGRHNGWEEVKLSDEELQFLRRKQVPQVKDTLMQLKSREMLPAIWFIFSRRGCDIAVRYAQDIQLLTDDEKSQVCEAVRNLRMEFPEAVRESAVLPLLQGVAAHHAGCLPLWKAFIEELFQRGLIKLVFATETLAAGINMPARTAVLSSLSKRGENGHSLLSSNSVLQMAGRAGRRGIDEIGHVVFMQTPFEGPEDCCKLLLSGPDPLVSQFTASYGMVLNLLAGRRLTTEEMGSTGRRLEEARALIEQSFGNFLGNEGTLEARQNLSKLEKNIEELRDQFLPNLESRITKEEYDEYVNLIDKVKQERLHMRQLRQEVAEQRLALVQPLLDGSLKDNLPFVCLCYRDLSTGIELLLPALCVDVAPYLPFSVKDNVVDSLNYEDNDASENGCKFSKFEINGVQSMSQIRFYVALGSNNVWYMFTGKSVKTIHRNDVMDFPAGDFSLKEFLIGKLPLMGTSWQNVGRSAGDMLSCVWCAESSRKTLHWCTYIPKLSDLKNEWKIPQELLDVENLYKGKRKRVSKLKKLFKGTQAYKTYLELLMLERDQNEKIAQLEEKRCQLISQMSQMQPSGWKEFLQAKQVLEDAGAISTDTYELLPLGETAARIRGANELWLAVVFTDALFLRFNPAQLAAICSSLVSEGIKIRSDGGPSYIYKTSGTVEEGIEALEEHRQWLLGLQSKHGVDIPCDLDGQLAGMVEAWASGVTWKELFTDCPMDEGDVARLLRRSIDLLAQLPHLQHLNPSLRNTARAAAIVMDRSPISELIV